MRPAPPSLLLLVLAACEANSTDAASTSADQARRLVGTWETTSEPFGRVTYAADGTCVSKFVVEADGERREVQGSGTWKVIDGAIHNTTLAHDEVPGMDPIELPYLSIEKIVSLQEQEYRYVCPVQGCTNTMRRVH